MIIKIPFVLRHQEAKVKKQENPLQMRSIIRENKLYFIYLTCFILLGGISVLVWQKPSDILFFSENRTAWADFFFRYATHLGEAPVYFIAAIIAFFYQPRHALSIAATGILVLGTSFSLKALFAVDRPLAYFQKADLIQQINFVEGVNLHSGPTSFPSGHAMAAFALYTLLAFLLPKRMGYATAMFLLATLVCLSRVYLVQHFWQDVYAGGLIGVVLALIVFAIYQRFGSRQPSFS